MDTIGTSTTDQLDNEEQDVEISHARVFDRELDVRWRKKEAALAIMQDLMIKGVKTVEDFKTNLAKIDPTYANLTDRTILRYKEIIANRNMQRLENSPVLKQTTESMALKMSDAFEMINGEFWKLYHQKESSRQVKATALKEIRETMKEHLKVMQSLGLIHEAPTKVQQVDAEGNPVNPNVNINIEKAEILQGFANFMNARFRDPLPSDKQAQNAQNEANTAIGQKSDTPQGA